MKLLKKRTGSGESQTFKKCARVHNNRTRVVRTFPRGRFQANNAPDSIEQDLLLAIEFGQAILESALLMSERLIRLENNASTHSLRETFKTAQANFEALRVRASAYPEKAAL